MLAQGQVGPIATTTSLAGGTPQTVRLDNTGALVQQELHGRYYEQAYRGNLFLAYSTATALTVAGTAMVGLQLWNGSTNKNVVLLKAGGFIFVTSATTTGILLGVGVGQPAAPTGQTAITASGPNFVGGAASAATPYNAGTFVNAPSPRKNLLHNTAAIAATGADPGFQVDLEGSIIIPPTCYCAFIALGATAAAASTNLHLMWEEVPV